MAELGKDHIYLDPKKYSLTEQYIYAGTARRRLPDVPAQTREKHATDLWKQARVISREMAAAIALQEESESLLDKGLIVEFESFEDIGNVFEEKSFGHGNELLNIRKDANKTFASVFIKNDCLKNFEKKINAYFEERKRTDGRPNDNRLLIDTISSFKKATVKALWTDTVPMPEKEKDLFCWEVWLTVRGDRQNQLDGFKELAKKLKIETSDTHFEFKERTVLLIRATIRQLEQSLDLLNNIAELRKAKATADFFVELKGKEQREWVADLLKRTVFTGETDKTSYICILDTGVNAAHPLIESTLSEDDLHSINDAWGKADIVGHGTEIAGLALYGDLTYVLESRNQIEIKHRLESSKIINAFEYIPDDAKRALDLYAEYTKQAVAQAEIPKPHRKRIFQMAVTTNDSQDKGKPSSWSAALDMLAAGMDDAGYRRLFVISAGNFNATEEKGTYPFVNQTTGIRDPGQAWNALAIGAYTEKDILSDEENIDGYVPVAAHGEISPYTTTSNEWNMDWPLKPDIVMEGGNIVENKSVKFQAHSLSLLTTHSKFHDKLFTATWATSAASALASKMCAQIMSKYPDIQPETVRALIVHSATWTNAMLRQFNCDKQNTNKTDIIKLVRTCGFGVPDLTRAMSSIHNDFTMIIEDSLQPYKTEKGQPKNNQMKFYSLPFPNDTLANLGEQEIEMRMTLSYFIEPNPSSRGRSRHSYQSHGLRFEVNNPTETKEHFKGRMNKALREDDMDYGNDTQDKWWTLGVRGRTKGSIHSDIWRGTAAELSSCDTVAVYPVSGWWRNIKSDKNAVNNIANYSLLISIRTSANIDLMSPVELKITNMVKTDIEV